MYEVCLKSIANFQFFKAYVYFIFNFSCETLLADTAPSLQTFY